MNALDAARRPDAATGLPPGLALEHPPLAGAPTAASFSAQLCGLANRLLDAHAFFHLRTLHRIALAAVIRRRRS